MASSTIARSFSRALPRRQLSTCAGRGPGFASNAAFRFRAPRGVRGYASESSESGSGGSSAGPFVFAALAAVVAGGGAYYYLSDERATANKPVDYQEVYNAVANVLEENAEEYDGRFSLLLT
jgi:cytochrome c peroxidase